MESKEITVHRVLWYVVIFSIAGLIIETLYGFITMGILESRKGLILGPFCPIYGVGAAFFIILLGRENKSIPKFFIYGSIAGTIFEYICSYVMQVMYGSRFWDYSYTNYHINGRVSLTYTVFWGILAVILIKFIKKWVDKYIDKISSEYLDKGIIIFLIIDVLITIAGISVYMNRAKCKYEMLEYKETALDYIFNDKLMSYTFPNLRYINNNGDEIFIREIIK